MEILEVHPSELKQSWWHIEDNVEPSNGRLVIRVQDFYIKKKDFERNNCFPIEVKPSFVGFKVKNKNSGKELSFIEEYGNKSKPTSEAILTVNLGREDDWEPVGESDYLHFKIQYEYVESWPIFLKRFTWHLGVKTKVDGKTNNKNCKDHKYELPEKWLEKIKLLWLPGYTGQFVMSGISQGEISITTPKGMNIQKKGKNAQIILYKGPVTDDTDKILMEYCEPHISDYNNKLKHHYVIDKRSYKQVLSAVDKHAINPQINFLVTYCVVNDRKFYLISGFSILFLISILLVKWDSTNLFYFVIMLLSLSTLYITLRKEKYQIPLNNFVFYSIPLSLFFLCIKLYFLYPNKFLNIFLYIRSFFPF